MRLIEEDSPFHLQTSACVRAVCSLGASHMQFSILGVMHWLHNPIIREVGNYPDHLDDAQTIQGLLSLIRGPQMLHSYAGIAWLLPFS